MYVSQNRRPPILESFSSYVQTEPVLWLHNFTSLVFFLVMCFFFSVYDSPYPYHIPILAAETHLAGKSHETQDPTSFGLDVQLVHVGYTQ